MLPPNAQLLINLMGEAAAYRLMQPRHYGGRFVLIPKGESGHGEHAFAGIAEIIGYDHAKRLIKTIGGGRFYIPSCSKMMLAQRNRQIVVAYNNGSSVAELCRQYELSDRQIHTILKMTDMSGPVPAKQTELF